MRFMMIVKANRDSEAGRMPSEALLTAMGKLRQLFGLDDFEPSPALEPFRELEKELAKAQK